MIQTVHKVSKKINIITNPACDICNEINQSMHLTSNINGSAHAAVMKVIKSNKTFLSIVMALVFV
jgi:hypothetical protein